MKKYKKNRYIRILSNEDEDCDEEVFTFDKNKTFSLMDNNSEGLEFIAKYNKNNNIDVKTDSTRKLFSESSFEFSIKTIDNSNGKKRNIQNKENDSSDIQIYEIRLRIPDKKSAADFLSETTCSLYPAGNRIDTSSCVTWYEEIKFEAVCLCEGQGLVVNIQDKNIAAASKIKQFPQIDQNFCNKYFNYLNFF
jgi:hypothetical protein